MKNYLIKLSILLSMLLPVAAFAIQEVSMGSGSIINVGGINLTISANPDSVVVNDAGTFTVTLSTSGSFTLVSADKRTMTFSQPAGANQLTTTLTCNANDSTYVIGNPTPGATGLQITVTPTINTCTGAGTSGSGGASGGAGSGGGGGASISGGSPAPAPAPTPAPAPAPVSTPAVTVSLPTPPVPAVSPVVPATVETTKAVSVMISKQVSYGERSDDVKKVQEAFARDKSIYPEGSKTGLFGPATKRAVQRFQVKYSVAKSGDVGYGVFGPKTRAKFNEVYGAAIPASAPIPVSTPASLMSAEARTALISSLLRQLAVLQEALKQLQASGQ